VDLVMDGTPEWNSGWGEEMADTAPAEWDAAPFPGAVEVGSGSWLPEAGTENVGPVNERNCMRTQCGFVTQAEAGWDFLLACSLAGYAGVRPGCIDATCLPYAEPGDCQDVPAPEAFVPPSGPDLLPFPVPAGPTVQLAKPMPSITGSVPARYPAIGASLAPPLECGFARWVDSNKLLAAGLVVGGFLLLRR
jgi:hypothetical protein